MDARTLLSTAIDADKWLAKSAGLRRAGNRLWDSFLEAFVRYGLEAKSNRKDGAAAVFSELQDYLSAAKLLYGLAIEAGLKAYLLRRQPSTIEFRLIADGTGELQSAEMKQFGVPLGTGHNLEQLAQKAGLLVRENNPVLPLESDQRVVRDLLKHLSDVVYWSGRYPVPMRSGDEYERDSSVPGVAYGHYIRDWLDPLMDFLQGMHAPPSSFEEGAV